MKKASEKVKKTTVILMLALSIGIIFSYPAFSGTSISGTATCRVPHLITLSDGRKVAAESKPSKQETLVTETEENKEDTILENNPNLIQQEEEIISEDNAEVKQITTVCAK